MGRKSDVPALARQVAQQGGCGANQQPLAFIMCQKAVIIPAAAPQAAHRPRPAARQGISASGRPPRLAGIKGRQGSGRLPKSQRPPDCSSAKALGSPPSPWLGAAQHPGQQQAFALRQRLAQNGRCVRLVRHGWQRPAPCLPYRPGRAGERALPAMPRPTACISRAARQGPGKLCAGFAFCHGCRTILSFRIIIAHLPLTLQDGKRRTCCYSQRQNLFKIRPPSCPMRYNRSIIYTCIAMCILLYLNKINSQKGDSNHGQV